MIKWALENIKSLGVRRVAELFNKYKIELTDTMRMIKNALQGRTAF